MVILDFRFWIDSGKIKSTEVGIIRRLFAA
jgi:hypothetical protein